MFEEKVKFTHMYRAGRSLTIQKSQLALKNQISAYNEATETSKIGKFKDKSEKCFYEVKFSFFWQVGNLDV